jgi:hypothetical protein
MTTPYYLGNQKTTERKQPKVDKTTDGSIIDLVVVAIGEMM